MKWKSKYLNVLIFIFFVLFIILPTFGVEIAMILLVIYAFLIFCVWAIAHFLRKRKTQSVSTPLFDQQKQITKQSTPSPSPQNK